MRKLQPTLIDFNIFSPDTMTMFNVRTK